MAAPGCASSISGRGTGLDPGPVTMASAGCEPWLKTSSDWTEQLTTRAVRIRQSRALRQGTTPVVCVGQLSGAAGVRGRGRSG